MTKTRTDPDQFNRTKMRNAWRRLAGLPEEEEPRRMPSYDEIRKSEWSPAFERLMRDRLVMGAFRYGLLNAEGKPQYDRIASIVKRAELYRETGDDQLLADMANLALCEFEEGTHPLKHVGDGEMKGDFHVETV